MPSFSDLFSKKYLRFISTRILLGLAAVSIYLIILRPVRLAITEHVVYPQVKYLESEEADFSSRLETGALLIYYDYGDGAKQLQYRPEFGFFFLIAGVALLFVTVHKKPYLILAVLHLAGSVLAYLFLITGAAGIQSGFIFTDVISGYLTPALSLALVPLVIRRDFK